MQGFPCPGLEAQVVKLIFSVIVSLAAYSAPARASGLAGCGHFAGPLEVERRMLTNADKIVPAGGPLKRDVDKAISLKSVPTLS